ncbi:hypothetical protein [Streptomyces uncialis]|uniref:hypothetical protein n=1 Tax=Streptomyces uncialis TaxID=1048205 RepID=UPI0033FD482C
MSVHQLPEQIREFAVYFNNLLARVDQAAGWCGVFWQRDPDGMRACLEGREVPPWDVVEALLQDLAADQGARVARMETARARALHAASLSVFDTRPGGRDVLGERLGVMLGEQRYAAERRLELGRLIGTAASPQEADEYRRDLAWAQDDHERATARCGELRARLAELERREGAMGVPPAGAGTDGGGPERVVPLQRRSAGDDDPLTGPLPRPAERAAHPAGVPGPAGRPDADHPAGRPAGRTAFRAPGSPAATDRSAPDGRPGRPGSPRRFPHDPDPASGAAASAPVPSGPGAGAPEHPYGPGPARAYRSGPDGERTSAEPGPAREPSAPGYATGGPYAPQGPGVPGAPGAPSGYGGPPAPDGTGDGRPAPDRGTPGGHPRHTPPGPGTPVVRPPRVPGAPAPGSRTPDPRPPRFPQQAQQGTGGPAAWTPASGAGPVSGAGTGRGTRSPYPDPAFPGTPGPTADPGPRTDPAPGPGDPGPPGDPRPTPRQRPGRRLRGARFAGADDATDPGPAATPTPPSGTKAPRGARFAGALGRRDRAPQPEPAPDDVSLRATAEAVDRLVRLRSEGRGGEAHGVLVEAAYGPADRFPLLAAGLHRAGLAADWATLLWEAASLPVERLVAIADVLASAGRVQDAALLLRQGVGRPPSEIGEVITELTAEGRRREVRALVEAYVRVRAPEEIARCAGTDPARLVPLLLAAAEKVSDQRRWDLVHALRVAGIDT